MRTMGKMSKRIGTAVKIVIAIDSFKGSLSSLEASRAAKAGIEKVCQQPNRQGRIRSGAGNEAADEIAYREIERSAVFRTSFSPLDAIPYFNRHPRLWRCNSTIRQKRPF